MSAVAVHLERLTRRFGTLVSPSTSSTSMSSPAS